MRSESSDEERVDTAPEYRPGSEADFERLYRNSYRRILGTLITMLRDRSAAEDCTQDAFERAFKAWKTWRPDAPAEAWLHRIAINVAINGQRKERLQEVGGAAQTCREAHGLRGPRRSSGTLRPAGRPPQAASEAGGRDRAAPLPRLFEPRDRDLAGGARTDGRLSPGGRSGPAPGSDGGASGRAKELWVDPPWSLFFLADERSRRVRAGAGA